MAKARIGTMSRSMARRQADDLIESFPRELQAKLAPHLDEYCDALVWGMRNPTIPGQYGDVSNPGHRTAMDLIGRIMRAFPTTEALLLQTLVIQLGAPIADAQMAVQQVASAPKDPHEIAKAARAYLDWYDGPDGPRGSE